MSQKRTASQAPRSDINITEHRVPDRRITQAAAKRAAAAAAKAANGGPSRKKARVDDDDSSEYSTSESEHDGDFYDGSAKEPVAEGSEEVVNEEFKSTLIPHRNISFAYGFTNPGGQLEVCRDVKLNKPWPNSNQAYGIKTQTAVLFRIPPATAHFTPIPELVAFGSKAIHRVSRLGRADRKNHAFFNEFKLRLYRASEAVQNADTVAALDGMKLRDTESGHDMLAVDMLAVDMIAACLKEVGKLALEQINQAQGREHAIHTEDVLWTVTVPAIWAHGAKKLMRDAGERSGLIPPGRPASLHLALEPEAASMACLSEERNLLKEGETYMVVDCGGGTVDVTVHTVKQGAARVTEAVPAGGGSWGSKVIDLAFQDLLGEIFGVDLVASAKRERPHDWLNLMDEWQKQKCAFEDEPLSVPLPQYLLQDDGKSCHELLFPYSTSAESTIERYNIQRGNGSSGSDGPLIELLYGNILAISVSEFERLASAPIQSIIAYIDKTIAAFPSLQIRRIFLVGNFAMCKPLQRALRDRFEPERRLLVSEGAGVSIVKGAVVLGNSPRMVMERMARKAVGVAITRPFRDGVDPKSKKFYRKLEKSWYCDSVANWFVEYGTAVPFGTVIRKRYYPVYGDQTQVSFEIFEGDGAGISYVDHPRCRKLGRISTGHVSSASLKTYGVDFSMLFGHTEVIAKTIDPYGHVVEAKIEYFD
ncbi:hypothetical protein HDU96_009899 [Phlyctochytrium bullatum]|nr:hypothetical protein HDU96_009899 [Phlyctochytrium bullatum]